MFTDAQIERYSRQIILPQVGGRGQQALLSCALTIVGNGTASRIAATYLAAAGIGAITLVDDKSVSTAAALDGLNPDCRILAHTAALTADSAGQLVRDHDLIIAAGGATPVLLNAACVTARRPLLWMNMIGAFGAVAGFAGYQADAPCYQCLHSSTASAATAALSGLTAGFMGSVLATEAIKIVLGLSPTLIGRLFTYDAPHMSAQVVLIAKDRACPACRSTHDAQVQ